jgi:hypothetical protein
MGLKLNSKSDTLTNPLTDFHLTSPAGLVGSLSDDIIDNLNHMLLRSTNLEKSRNLNIVKIS